LQRAKALGKQLHNERRRVALFNNTPHAIAAQEKHLLAPDGHAAQPAEGGGV
jgi:hypothetical protein